jgi:hypothetical protein
MMKKIKPYFSMRFGDFVSDIRLKPERWMDFSTAF